MEIARQLEKLGVDVIEAGFPASSPLQLEAVQRVSAESKAVVAALARAVENDITAAWKAVQQARKPRIHTFIGTSDIHIAGKFGSDRYGVYPAGKAPNRPQDGGQRRHLCQNLYARYRIFR